MNGKELPAKESMPSVPWKHCVELNGRDNSAGSHPKKHC